MTHTVTAHWLNVRSAPSIHGAILEVLARDTKVAVVDRSGDGYWYRVQTPTHTQGWASHKYLQALGTTDPADPPWLQIALAEEGVREFPGAGDNPRVVEYLRSTNLPGSMASQDETAWCSAFVNWCFERAGYEGTDSAWARSWLNWGHAITEPVRGCVTVLTRGTDGGHVGFFIDRVNPLPDAAIRLLGGNQNNAVTLADFSFTRFRGYRMPGPATFR